MKFFFNILTIAYFIGCASATPKRSTSSENIVVRISSPTADPGGALILPPFQCPAGTTLQSAAVDVNLSRCLQEYIHRESSHGLIRERICFHTGTKHESRMRMGQKNKIYAALVKKIQYPIPEQNAYVSLNLNHAYYSLEWKPESTEVASTDLPSKKEVIETFRQIPLPKKVSLERCECDLTQISKEDCLQRIAPLLQLEQIYRFESSPAESV